MDPPEPIVGGETLPAKPIALDYAGPLPRGRSLAAVIRWTMLVLAVLAILAALIGIFHPLISWWQYQAYLGGGVMGTPAGPLRQLPPDGPSGLSMPELTAIRWVYLPEALLYFGIFLLTQWLFLCPRGSWRIGASQNDPPGRRAAVAAGFIGMLLSIGFLATLMELPGWWVSLTTEGGIGTQQHFGVVWIVAAVIWGGWTWVFSVYWRSLERYTALSRAFRWLVAGTILELAVAAPAHAMIVSSRNQDCYCELGTYTGVAFGCTAALWLFGPGAFLLFLRERRRRASLLP
jgi:hypothetical protein